MNFSPPLQPVVHPPKTEQCADSATALRRDRDSRYSWAESLYTESRNGEWYWDELKKPHSLWHLECDYYNDEEILTLFEDYLAWAANNLQENGNDFEAPRRR